MRYRPRSPRPRRTATRPTPSALPTTSPTRRPSAGSTSPTATTSASAAANAPGPANPAVFANTVYNAAGGQVALKVGLIGSATTVTAGHAAGASSLCYGYDLAATDHADAVVCLGADTLTDTVITAYKELGVL